MKLKFLAVVAVAVLAFSTVSFADTLTLDSSANQSGTSGQTFSFSGTYFSDIADGLLFNWTSASPCDGPDAYACVDATNFIFASSGAPSSFFDVFVDLDVAPGLYTGTVQLTSAGDTISDPIDFSIDVTGAPTPEPGSLALLGTGLVGLAGAVRRKLSL